MIISDHYKFAFIHIPKCAGTTIRKPLQELDDREGAYTRRVEEHPTVGPLDFVHMPLFTLQKYFHDDFLCVQNYWSFSVVRDPLHRFASSVSQRALMYSDKPVQKMAKKEIEKHIDESIGLLLNASGPQALLPPELIHFQRQVDYIYLEGERVVDSIYSLETVENLKEDIENTVKDNLYDVVHENGKDSYHLNKSLVYSSDFLRIVIESIRPASNIISKRLPPSLKSAIRSKVYVARDDRLGDILYSSRVQNFVSDYYKEDIALYDQVKEYEAAVKV